MSGVLASLVDNADTLHKRTEHILTPYIRKENTFSQPTPEMGYGPL